jgi:acid phosphatase family membrane protein YuiD
MRDFRIWEIFLNAPLLAAAFAMGSAQLYKAFKPLFTGKGFSFKSIADYGGFPSGHTAFIVACAIALGIDSGFRSGIFALAVTVACMLIYDIIKQRKVVDLTRQETDRLLVKAGLTPLEPAPQFKAHSVAEIVGGGIWGAVCAVAFCFLLT